MSSEPQAAEMRRSTDISVHTNLQLAADAPRLEYNHRRRAGRVTRQSQVILEGLPRHPSSAAICALTESVVDTLKLPLVFSRRTQSGCGPCMLAVTSSQTWHMSPSMKESGSLGRHLGQPVLLPVPGGVEALSRRSRRRTAATSLLGTVPCPAPT